MNDERPPLDTQRAAVRSVPVPRTSLTEGWRRRRRRPRPTRPRPYPYVARSTTSPPAVAGFRLSTRIEKRVPSDDGKSLRDRHGEAAVGADRVGHRFLRALLGQQRDADVGVGGRGVGDEDEGVDGARTAVLAFREQPSRRRPGRPEGTVAFRPAAPRSHPPHGALDDDRHAVGGLSPSPTPACRPGRDPRRRRRSCAGCWPPGLYVFTTGAPLARM